MDESRCNQDDAEIDRGEYTCSNLAISVAGIAAGTAFSSFIIDSLPDNGVVSKTQVFPRYHYEEVGIGE